MNFEFINTFRSFVKLFNCFIFIINIFFFLYKKNEYSTFFKNSDLYIFSSASIYKKHFQIKNNSFNSLKQKKVSIYCVDTLNNSVYIHYYKNMIKNQNLIIEINKDHPDFLIYDVFGCEHLNEKYNDSVKIAFYSENIIPDFSESDYSLSQPHIIYLDRYFKYPSFIYRLKKFSGYKVKDIKTFAKNKKKTKFCAAVISNPTQTLRVEFIKKLNKYKHVDMGGSYLNNVGGKVKDKIEFLSSYKFSIAMENSNGDGYISEKIVESLIAGTIPIYYGSYLIDEYINPRVFILIKGEKDIESKIEYIKKIDRDEELYNSILQEKIFINEKYNDIIEKTESEKKLFLDNIFLQSKNEAKRIDDVNSIYNCKK